MQEVLGYFLKIMRIKSKLLLITFITLNIFFAFFSGSLYAREIIKIAAGSKEGLYYKFGQILKGQLEEKGFDVKVLVTQGSVNNLMLLETRQADLAFVQNNIAYNYYSKELKEGKTFKYIVDLKAILGLYLEKMHILIRKEARIKSIYDFEYKNRKIVIGEKNSGTRQGATSFLNPLNIELKPQKFLDYNFSKAKTEILNNKIDGIMFMIGTPNKYVVELLNTNKITLLGLENILLDGFKSKHPCFLKTSIDNNIYKNLKEKINTFATYSLLVCDGNLNGDIINNILEIFKTKKDLFAPFNIEFSNFENIEKFKEGISIPLHRATEQFIGVINYKILNKTVCLLILCGLLIALFAILRYHPYFIKTYRKWESQIADKKSIKIKLSSLQKCMFDFMSIYRALSTYLFLFFGLFLYLFGITLGINLLEISYFHVTDEVSRFINFSLRDMITWIWVFASTGFEQEVFPNHSFAKVLVGTIPLIGMSGAIFLLGKIGDTIIKIRREKIMGARKLNCKNHVVFYGFNKRVPAIIKMLRRDTESGGKPIVIIANFEGDYKETLIKYNLDNLDGIEYVRKTEDINKNIENANIPYADTIVAVADDTKEDPDADTILSIMMIEKYLKNIAKTEKGKQFKDVYSIVELVKPQSKDIIKEAEIDEIIIRDDLMGKIISQTALKPGISELVDELLTSDEFNEIYSVDVNNIPSLEGKTFDEILLGLRKYNVLLLGIRIMKNKYVGSAEVQNFLKPRNLKRKIISNPVDENEKNYIVTKNDQIFVLAKDWSVVKKICLKP